MILITGAAGLSGSAIVREFARQGARVRALVRSRRRAQELLGFPSVEVVEGDMSKPETLGAALDGIDRALLVSSSNAHMLETQCSFIDTGKRAGVKHVVKFSGGESGFDASKFRFAQMHEDIEDYLEQSGLAWTHLRPSQFMQVYLREAPTVIRREALVLPMAEATLAPVDVDDIAKIAVAVLLSGAHQRTSFTITGPEALNMSAIAECLGRAIGKSIRYVPISPESRRETLLAAGTLPYIADALYEQAIERLRNPHAQVHLETHNTFAVKPTTFVEFANRHVAAFRPP